MSATEERHRFVTVERKKVLILGGYGIFGERIARTLAGDSRLEIWIAGRDQDKAKTLAREIRHENRMAKVAGVRLDANIELAKNLNRLGIDIVINCIGPFQGATYSIPLAVISAGAHYLDLADSRDFVVGFNKTLDAKARAAGVVALTGASSVPALSSAVIDTLAKDFKQMNEVMIAILPGNQTPRSQALVDGVLSYAGKPMPVWRDGVWQKLYGWQGLKKYKAETGLAAELNGRPMSLFDVPDLQIFPDRYVGLTSVTFYAGLELKIMHWPVSLASWLVRFRLLPSLTNFSKLGLNLSKRLHRLGHDHGGLIVEISGQGTSGQNQKKTFTLMARDGDGPYIPCLASAIVATKLAAGVPMEPGARPCLDTFTLDEFLRFASHLNLEHEIA